jgi:hypothetical protein
MYLRSAKRTNKDGSTAEYYQLAHNERHPVTRKPFAKIIHNFGRADKLDRDELVRLCRSIARVCGLVVTDPLEPLQLKESLPAGLPDDLQIGKTLPLGCSLIIEALWEQLGLKKTIYDILNENGLHEAHERALLSMTITKLYEPDSLLPSRTEVYIPNSTGVKLGHLLKSIELLYKNAAKIEKAVFLEVAKLFYLNVNLIFYFTSKAFYHSDQKNVLEFPSNIPLHMFGHKVAVAVTREGIPFRSWILPINDADITTVERVRSDLSDWNIGRALFVADISMNPEDNRIELSRTCGKYLLVCRMANVAEIKREVINKKGQYEKFAVNLQAKEVIVDDGEGRRRYVICYDPEKGSRDCDHREKTLSLLEAKFKAHKDHSATTRWAIYLLASRRFKRYLRVTKAGKVRIDRTAIRDSEKCDGKWVLETNDDTISFEDAVFGFMGLMNHEHDFRSLKRTPFGALTVFKNSQPDIEGRIKIAFLALMIKRIAELRCGIPWHQIRDALDELQVTEFFTSNNCFFIRNELSYKILNIFELFKIDPPDQLIGIETPSKKKQPQKTFLASGKPLIFSKKKLKFLNS